MLAARPKRASAKATADKISASLKSENAKIGEQQQEPPRAERVAKPTKSVAPKSEATGRKSGKRPIVSISLLDDDDDVDPVPAKTKRPASSKAVAAAAAGAGAEDVLLGHFVSKCVGIQHYRQNGERYTKEPLHLRRDPTNVYDRNAIAVRTLTGRSVGQVQRVDALAVARVADDKALRIKLVAQVDPPAHAHVHVHVHAQCTYSHACVHTCACSPVPGTCTLRQVTCMYRYGMYGWHARTAMHMHMHMHGWLCAAG